MEKKSITTVDNPFNPITQFDEWYAYDFRNGYHTCEVLARISNTSNELSDKENDDLLEDAYNEMIKTGTFDKEGNPVEYKVVRMNDENAD